MNIDETTIRDLCTDAVFERGQKYRNERRIQRIERFDDVVTAVVQGSSQYDVTVELGDKTIDARCTCPYDDAGECKHVVAVLLDVAADPPRDESGRVDSVLQNVSADGLRPFLRDVLAERPDLRDQFLARFADTSKSVEEYRAEIEHLFDRHTQDYPVVTDAIDFSHFFELAEQYHERERYLEAAAVYRALFEEIDDNEVRIDAAYDHYAKALEFALDGYVECVLAADSDQDEFEKYIGALEDQATSEQPANTEQFYRAIDDLEERR
ncbi:SWIM zinc finger family protein [Haloplanus pelagicus]|uniref:SWIM zinc finger family protein n=1 Tax=Haloplanus pelagicus TaxID=2949995 RepID=UPI00203C2DC6|nr:SWIM zinc finger family protein [Haloplanus sp. HW8-1]